MTWSVFQAAVNPAANDIAEWAYSNLRDLLYDSEVVRPSLKRLRSSTRQ